MHADFRRVYNQLFSPSFYEQYRNRLQAVVGPVPYRLAESPLFIESEPRQAEEICRLADKPVLCLTEQRMYQPGMSVARVARRTGRLLDRIGRKVGLAGRFTG